MKIASILIAWCVATGGSGISGAPLPANKAILTTAGDTAAQLVMRNFIAQQRINAPIHAIFFISRPRQFIYGEALLSRTIEYLHELGFKGSITVVVRGQRYYADLAYIRQQRWVARVFVDTTGEILAAARIRPHPHPHLTVWDSSGRLLYRVLLGGPQSPTRVRLDSLLTAYSHQQAGTAGNEPIDLLPDLSMAAGVGYSEAAALWRTPLLSSRVWLHDDSSTATGSLRDPVISSNHRWMAAMDAAHSFVRVYDAYSGEEIAVIRPDSTASRALSWWYPDSINVQTKRMMIGAAQFPFFVDSILYVHHIYGYVHNTNIGDATFIGINKVNYLFKYEPPFQSIAGGTLLTLTPYIGECHDCFCRFGIYHPGAGFAIAGDYVYFPFKRGFPALTNDTSEPYNNPRREEFYEYAPLYGAFSLSNGWYTGKTLGTLNKTISQYYGLGFWGQLMHQLGCRADGLCGWVQWLSPVLEMSNGQSLRLKTYWNPSMFLTKDSPLPPPLPIAANETLRLYDSAAATIHRIWLTDSVVFILWKLKAKGFNLEDEQHGFYVLQRYQITSDMLDGEWVLPTQLDGEYFVNCLPTNSQDTIIALYQGVRSTSVAKFLLQ